MRLRFVAAVTAAVGLLVFAGSAPAVIGGQADAGEHPYVAAVLVPGAGLCTAAALDENTLLTAAHCVFDGGFAFVSFDEAPLPGGFPPPQPADLAKFHVGVATVMPGFCMGCGPGLPSFASNDVALIELFQPVSLPRYAQLPTAGYSDSLRKASLTLVGYGAQGFAAQVPVSNFQRTKAEVRLSPSKHTIADSFLKLSGGAACVGDSGGPVLDGDVVVAVNSFLASGRCASPDYAQRVDTAAVLGFIAGG